MILNWSGNIIVSPALIQYMPSLFATHDPGSITVAVTEKRELRLSSFQITLPGCRWQLHSAAEFYFSRKKLNITAIFTIATCETFCFSIRERVISFSFLDNFHC